MTSSATTPQTYSKIPVASDLSATAPWGWLAKAWTDYKRQPILSAGYGVLFVALGYGIIFGLKALDMVAVVPVAIGAFALIGPILAAGIYPLAKKLEDGGTPSWRDMIFVKAAAPIQIAYLGVLLMVGLFIWTLCALALLVIFAAHADIASGEFVSFALGTTQGLSLLTVGTVIGGAIAFAIYAASAFSIPMLIDKDVDFATAIGASVNAVINQTKAMILWAWIIGASIAFGAATLLFGFIILFPLIGLATWHGYREAFGE